MKTSLSKAASRPPHSIGVATIALLSLLLCLAVPLKAVAQSAPATAPASQPGEIPSWLSGAVRAGGVTPESRRDCVICHLDWSESFNRPGAVLLIDKPAGPVVMEPETCLGCHDGGVGDARKRVWREHGHKVGIAPPPGMVVPDILPLQNGQIACRTCHSAHGGLGPQTIATIVFLRVQNDKSQLCMLCHTDQAKGPSAGMHFLGKMDQPVPPPIVAAGGKAGPADFNVICQSCHTAHGVQEQHMLILPTDNNVLCAPCHADKTPGEFRSPAAMPHPQNPPLQTPAQHQAIKEMGTVIGADDRLICLSCHKVHNAMPDSYILAETLQGSKLCIRCHPDMANTITDTPHDLRKTAPDSHNLRGQTPVVSGPCGTCHGFHSFVRTPEPRPGDPTGQCTTCHQEGGVAAEHSGLPLSHPTNVTAADIHGQPGLPLYPPRGKVEPRMLACLTCHQPHRPEQGKYLREPKDTLCSDCHADQAAHLPEAHNFTGKPDLTNGRDETAHQSGKCGFCHAVHNALGPMMWVAQKNAPQTADQLCTLCHRQDGMDKARSPGEFSHPTGPAAPGDKATIPAALPLFDRQGHVTKPGFVACGSCHDPHMGKQQSASMLRGGAAPSGLCVQCHTAEAGVAEGPHDSGVQPANWPSAAQGNALCMACHKAHSDDPASRLWRVTQAAQPGDPADAVCVACHASASWAAPSREPSIGQMVHPRMLTNLVEVPALPLAPATQGSPWPALECLTCHNPHSNRADWHLLRQTQVAQPQGVCFSCHTSASYLDQSLHAPWVSPTLQSRTQVCGPCHAVHAVPGSMQTDLWAAGLNLMGADLAAKECLACHGPAGPGKSVHVVVHADVLMPWMVSIESVGGVPLSQITSQGRISCITCHLPHGRPTVLPVGAGGPHPPLAALQASKPMLRSNVPQDLCSMCHGFNAVRLYLYFHRPSLRPQVFPVMPPSQP